MTEVTPRRSPMGTKQLLEYLVQQSESTKTELLTKVENLQLEVASLKTTIEQSRTPTPPQEILPPVEVL